MKYSWQSEQTEQKKCDRVLILVLAIIIVTGLVILYSTSAYNGEIKFQGYVLLSEKTGICNASRDYGYVVYSEYRLSYLEKVGSSGISVIYFTRSTGNVVRRRIQWVKRWLSFGPIFFSAIGICKGCGDSVPDIYHTKKCRKNVEIFNSLQDCYQCVANCRSGWGEQFEHSGYYSGNSSHPGICRKSEVWAICVDGVSGVCIYGDISCYGKLPA